MLSRAVLTCHEELRVGVEINVHLQALCGFDVLDVCGELICLCGVSLGGSTVVFCAGIGGSATCDVPDVWPVTVDVNAGTRGAGVGLAVLAPETVSCLGVDEAWDFVRFKDEHGHLWSYRLR